MGEAKTTTKFLDTTPLNAFVVERSDNGGWLISEGVHDSPRRGRFYTFTNSDDAIAFLGEKMRHPALPVNPYPPNTVVKEKD